MELRILDKRLPLASSQRTACNSICVGTPRQIRFGVKRKRTRELTGEEQRMFLEQMYAQCEYPSALDVSFLRRILHWPHHRVLKWFGNRRAQDTRAIKKRRLVTSSLERDRLEKAFHRLLSSGKHVPADSELLELQRALNWSRSRVLKWFDNRRSRTKQS